MDIAMPAAISTLGLPAEDSYFMQHYIHNIARIALAIDYTGNGYRSLLPMALREPAVLNAALAVAASHHSRWQHTTDVVSRRYLRAASTALRDRFSKPEHIHSEVTLATMLLLWAASRLYASFRDGQITTEELNSKANELQEQIRSTEIILEANPLVSISCQSGAEPFSTIGMGQEELRRRMVATAEIFRHSSHIYVYRIVNGPEVPLTEEMEASLGTAQELLTMVPDALGPGANLEMGSEYLKRYGCTEI
ncbi:unnamed protein product [Parascedosporium putredinis]|uniref:Uncharacterized protein n=1 Tax=Parascedosporium putredinis TaxID=1442378 RepID=A0A9P1M8A9_9PEZI|nr:unnamed protein product [Parascedosporium putredinis]CAI7993273.1 unnamed protein product [Parascedosporium putredinis]